MIIYKESEKSIICGYSISVSLVYTSFLRGVYSMARAVAARMEGDDYQSLVFWKYATDMLSDDSEICRIEYESDCAVKSFDDIVLHYSAKQRFRDGYIAKAYIQVKFHVIGNDMFTFDNLVDPAFISAKKNSFLGNVNNARNTLGDRFFDSKFVIYSPISISPTDELYQYVSNTDGTIDLKGLFNGTGERSKTGKIRKMLCEALGVSDEELKQVLRQVVIKDSTEKTENLIEALNEKFSALGMKKISGETGTNPYEEIGRTWIERNIKDFTKEKLERECQHAKLFNSYDGSNTEEFFFNYRKRIRETENRMKTIVDKSSDVKLIGAGGAYIDRCVLVNGEKVLVDSIDKVLNGGLHLIISAVSGYGKTTILRRLLVDDNTLAKYVPVYIGLRSLREFRDENIIVDTLCIELREKGLRISVPEIEIALQKGKILLLLDGVDEVKSDNRDRVQKDIMDIVEKFPKSPILVTSRPCIDFSRLEGDFSKIILQPLTIEQAKDFIKRTVCDKTLSEKFCRELDEGLYVSHKDFAENPLLLSLMFMSYKRNKGIPNRLTDFYYTTFECLYKDFDNMKGNMQREYKTQLLSEVEFQNLLSYICVQSYFFEEYDFDNRYLEIIITDGIRYLGLQEKIDDPKDFIYDLRNIVYILIQEGGEYRFIHRSFQTYFAAVFVMKFVTDDKQRAMFSKMIRGDRFQEFKEFFVLLRELEGDRCINNIFRDELLAIYDRAGEDKQYGILNQIFSKIGVAIIGKGNPGSEDYLSISDTDDFNYYIAYKKQDDPYLQRLIELFLFLNPLRYQLNDEEKKDFCISLTDCELEYVPPRLLLMPLEKITEYPPEIKDKVLNYHYRFYGIKDIVEYVEQIKEKENDDSEKYRNNRYYLAGII